MELFDSLASYAATFLGDLLRCFGSIFLGLSFERGETGDFSFAKSGVFSTLAEPVVDEEHPS